MARRTCAQANAFAVDRSVARLRSTPGAVEVGPVIFVALEPAAQRKVWDDADLPDSPDALVFKIPLNIDAERSEVTVSAEPSSEVRLLYSAAQNERLSRGALAWEQLPSTITFETCAPAEPRRGSRSGYPGGFIISGPVCAGLEISEPGRPSRRRAVPLAGARCPAA